MKPDHAQRHLATRYLEAFGPATVRDFAQFSLLAMSSARAAIESAATRRLEGPEGRDLYDVLTKTVPDGDTPAPARLLGMWDSTLLAYSERDRIIPPEYRPVVIRRNGNVLPTILVDGYVAGVWRMLDGNVEVSAFTALPKRLGRAGGGGGGAENVRGREGSVVVQRYHHWWAKGLEAKEVRSLR